MDVSPARAGKIKITYIDSNLVTKVLIPTSYPSETYTCINYGSTVILEATPSSGYRFDHWGGSVTGSTNPVKFVLKEAREITAYFTGSATTSITANAGPDQNVSENQQVTLNGTGSTGTISRYSWTQTSGPTVALSGSTSSRPTFTAPYVQEGGATLTFRLTVSNNLGQTDTDSVNVHVAWQDQLTASAGPDQSVSGGQQVTLNGTGSTGTIARYSWTQTSGPTVVLSGSTSSRPTFTAPYVQAAGATLTFLLTVSDNLGHTDSDSVNVRVASQNLNLAAAAGPDQSVESGATVVLDGSNSSPQSDIVSYQWVMIDNNLNLSGIDLTSKWGEGMVSFLAPEQSGWIEFELTVSGVDGSSDSDTVVVTITQTSGGSGLAANAGSDQAALIGTMVMLDGSGSQGDNLQYQWR